MPVIPNVIGVLRQPFLDARAPLDIKVAPNFSGFVVVQLKSTTATPDAGMACCGTLPPWFQIVLVSQQDVQINLDASQAFVVDFESGFQATPQTIWPFAREYLLLTETHGRRHGPLPMPGDCPIVT